MRHAKSGYSGDLSDFDRSLNERGNRSATALGKWLKDNSFFPDLALVSAATRTVQTFNELKISCPLEKKQKLYLASSEEIFHKIRQINENSLLVICNNTVISDFSQKFLLNGQTILILKLSQVVQLVLLILI